MESHPEFERYRRLLADYPKRDLPAFEDVMKRQSAVLVHPGVLGIETRSDRAWKSGGGSVVRFLPRHWQVAAATVVFAVGALALGYGYAVQSAGLRAAVLYSSGDAAFIIGGADQASDQVAGNFRSGSLEAGKILTAGSVLLTGKGGSADIVFGDGVVLRMKENTQLKLERLEPRPAGGRYFYLALERGRMFAVTEKLNENDVFIIRTADALVDVDRTAFRMSAGDDGTVVHLMRGHLDLRPRKGGSASVALGPRHVARVRETEERPILTRAPDMLFTDARELYEVSRRSTHVAPSALAYLGVGGRPVVGGAVYTTAGPRTSIELRDGSSLEGDMVSLVGRRVSFQAEGGRNYSLDVSDIKGIHYMR